MLCAAVLLFASTVPGLNSQGVNQDKTSRIMDSPGTHSFTVWRVASPQNWGLRHYMPAFLCEPMYLSSSLRLRISRLSVKIAVWGNLGMLIIGLGRQQEFHFVKYFKVLTLMSKCNKTKTLSIAFAKNKIKIIIKKERKKEKCTLHNSQELRLHLRSGH